MTPAEASAGDNYRYFSPPVKIQRSQFSLGFTECVFSLLFSFYTILVQFFLAKRRIAQSKKDQRYLGWLDQTTPCHRNTMSKRDASDGEITSVIIAA
jgi:hypothetical protein